MRTFLFSAVELAAEKEINRPRYLKKKGDTYKDMLPFQGPP